MGDADGVAHRHLERPHLDQRGRERGDPLGCDDAVVGASERGRQVRAHAETRVRARARRRRDTPRAMRRSVLLMLRRLKPSEAAAKIATSRTPAANARSRPARFGTRAGYRTPARRVMPAKTSPASARRRHPLRTHEGGHFDHRQAGGAQAIDEGDLVRRRDLARFVLQAVARPDLDDGDALRVAHRQALSTGPTSISGRPGWTSSPSRQWTATTVPSASARDRQLHLHRLQDRAACRRGTRDRRRATRICRTVAGIGAASDAWVA